MTIQARVVGIPNFNRRIKVIDRAVRKEVGEATQRGALRVRNDVVKSIARQSSGRKYTRAIRVIRGQPRIAWNFKEGDRGENLGSPHIASRAGQAPNTDSGNLINNIQVSTKQTRGAVFASVGSKAPYSKYLEFGTKWMEKRPFMRPALKKNTPAIRRLIIKAVREGNRRK